MKTEDKKLKQSVPLAGYVLDDLLDSSQDEACLFCGRKREELWRSSIIGITRKPGTVLFLATVCPPCRSKHTVEEVYEEIMKRGAAQ